MTEVVIKIFHKLDGERDLVRTINLRTDSSKPLNGKTALRCLRRAVPDLSTIAVLMRVEDGWTYSRTLQPKATCGFHYKWEEFLVYEDSSGSSASAA